MSSSKAPRPVLFCKFSWKELSNHLSCKHANALLERWTWKTPSCDSFIVEHRLGPRLSPLPWGLPNMTSAETIWNACVRTDPKSASPEHICWWAFVMQGKSWWGVRGHQGRNQPSALCSSDLAEQNGRGRGGDSRALHTHSSCSSKFPHCWTSGFQNTMLMSTFCVLPLSYWY